MRGIQGEDLEGGSFGHGQPCIEKATSASALAVSTSTLKHVATHPICQGQTRKFYECDLHISATRMPAQTRACYGLTSLNQMSCTFV